jgi:hypothetical protein
VEEQKLYEQFVKDGKEEKYQQGVLKLQKDLLGKAPDAKGVELSSKSPYLSKTYDNHFENKAKREEFVKLEEDLYKSYRL